MLQQAADTWLRQSCGRRWKLGRRMEKYVQYVKSMYLLCYYLANVEHSEYHVTFNLYNYTPSFFPPITTPLHKASQCHHACFWSFNTPFGMCFTVCASQKSYTFTGLEMLEAGHGREDFRLRYAWVLNHWALSLLSPGFHYTAPIYVTPTAALLKTQQDNV